MTIFKSTVWLRPVIDYIAFSAWAFWVGGFSFYFGVVIRVGSDVVGDSSQGFVTQGATWWLNIAALVALFLLLASAWMARSWFAFGAWVVIAVCQATLFLLHSRLDTLLDTPTQTILDRKAFDIVHEWYEFTSAIQWLFAMIYLGFWVASPRFRSGGASEMESQNGRNGVSHSMPVDA
ncbi:MAG: hypothetical protein ACK553_08740 [Planctomycetota bacterium]|jgi:hypothetical protein